MQLKETTETRFTSETRVVVTLGEVMKIIRNNLDMPDDAKLDVTMGYRDMLLSDIDMYDDELFVITWEKMTEKGGTAQERDIDLSSQV